MITASPGQSSTANQAAVADRLIALLPRRIGAVDAAPGVSQGELPVHRSAHAVNWIVITIYISVMLLSQWIATSFVERPPAGAAPTSLASGLPGAAGGH
jgi:hypothetical protein